MVSQTLRDPKKEIPQHKARDWQDEYLLTLKLDIELLVLSIFLADNTEIQSIMAVLNTRLWIRQSYDNCFEVDQLIPGGTNLPRDGALFTPSDGCAEPSQAAAVICTAARMQARKFFAMLSAG